MKETKAGIELKNQLDDNGTITIKKRNEDGCLDAIVRGHNPWVISAPAQHLEMATIPNPNAVKYHLGFDSFTGTAKEAKKQLVQKLIAGKYKEKEAKEITEEYESLLAKKEEVKERGDKKDGDELDELYEGIHKFDKLITDDIYKSADKEVLVHRVLLALLYKLDDENENRFKGKRAAKNSKEAKEEKALPIVGCRSLVENWCKEDKDFKDAVNLKDGWSVLIIEERDFTKFVYQREHLAGDDVGSLFRVDEVTEKDEKGKEVVKEKKGILFKMRDSYTYVMKKFYNEVVYIPATYIDVSKPFLIKGKKYHVVQLCPKLQKEANEQFFRIERRSIEYLLKGKKPAITFKLFYYLLRTNKNRNKNHEVRMSLKTKGNNVGLYDIVAVSSQYNTQPGRRAEDFKKALNDMQNIGLLDKYNITKDEVILWFNPKYGKVSE